MNWNMQVDEEELEDKHENNGKKQCDNCKCDNCKCYGRQVIKYIEAIYIIGLVLWFVLIMLLNLIEPDIIV